MLRCDIQSLLVTTRVVRCNQRACANIGNTPSLSTYPSPSHCGIPVCRHTLVPIMKSRSQLDYGYNMS